MLLKCLAVGRPMWKGKSVYQLVFELEQGPGVQASLIISLCLGPDLSALNKLQGPRNSAFMRLSSGDETKVHPHSGSRVFDVG